MVGKWTKWKPLSVLDNKYYIKSIKDDEDGFEIILAYYENKPEKERDKIKVIFSGPIESYRYCDEHCRLALLRKLDEKYGNGFYVKWRYFTVEDSEYLKWLNKESDGITEHLGVKHYVFIDNDCILDVVAAYKPEFEFIKVK